MSTQSEVTPSAGDLAAELAALRQSGEQRDARSAKAKKTVLIGLLVAVGLLVALWSTGRMDPFLSQFGLNKNDCVKNGFGATFCGADATAYQQNVSAITNTASGTPSAAEGNVRAAIPSAEAYYSDNGSYAGMTIALLRQIDNGIASSVVVGSVNANSYCLEDDSGGTPVRTLRGAYAPQGGNVTTGSC